MFGQKYSFWWTPKPMNNDRRSTRAQKGTPNTIEPYRNVMYDKRVVRGSNYASFSEMDPFDKASEVRRRNLLRKRILSRNQRNVIGAPPVAGRRHEIIQTEKYLEELLYTSVTTVDTQTDLFLEKPPTPPPYIPAKVGIDVGTSIEEGDLLPVLRQEEDDLLIQRFAELCIIDAFKEIVLEDRIGEATISEIHQNQVDRKTLEVREPDNNPCLSNQEATVVDPTEILTDIIEKIIRQRNEIYKTLTLGEE